MTWWDEFDRWFMEWFSRRPFFSEMFGRIDRMIEDFSREFLTDVPKELFQEKRFSDGSIVRAFGPFVYGYSMTVGPDGKPHIRMFGNVKPGVPFPRPMEYREPLVDIIPTPTHIKVIVELPGIRKEDIDLRTTEIKMTVMVNTEERKYYKEIELPEKVDPKSAVATFNNGLLEVTLSKFTEERPGERVEIK